jgi:hypothetical protein
MEKLSNGFKKTNLHSIDISPGIACQLLESTGAARLSPHYSRKVLKRRKDIC